MRTKDQIEEKIKELTNDRNNFTYVSIFDSELMFSEIRTDKTLRDFATWLLKDEKDGKTD